MTSIRPPSASSPAVTGLDPSSEAEAVSPASVGASGSTRGAQATAASAEAQPSWVAQLEAGHITREQAIDGLVNQALEAHGAARLSPSARAELAEILRGALLEDPVLSQLLG